MAAGSSGRRSQSTAVKEDQMRKLIFVAALVALLIGVPLASGSSHREAPLTSIDPTGDNTDTYAFTAKDAPGNLTIVANWIPFEDPAGGPNFYQFDDNAHYYLNIDNTGDGKPDIRYLFDFNTKTRDPNTFLYGLGKPIQGVNSPNQNLVQSYTLTREKLQNGSVVSSKVLGTGLPTPPDNVGPKTTPGYEQTAEQAVKSLPGGGKVFAGQRDDPFFVSLGRIFDTVNLTGAGLGNMGGGVDDLAGYAVHSTVLQVPDSQVTRNGKSVKSEKSKNAVVGVWASTERQAIDVNGKGSGAFHQISRLGNPLVNEVIIPLAKKDEFNRTTPDQDAARYGKFVLNPVLAAALNALFPGKINAPEHNRTDIVQAVLQGIPGLNAFPGKAGQNATDTIKINLGTPPTANPNRLGVLGGDNQGYPNGRRLTDDVVDIDLQVVAGALKGNKVPLGDGVNQNDVPFLTKFPYVAPPNPGANPDYAFGSRIKALAQEGGDVFPSLSGSSSTATSGSDGDGPSAMAWVLIAAAGLAVIGMGGATLRRRGSQ
jgi:Domain of unknown function (DUF4331)